MNCLWRAGVLVLVVGRPVLEDDVQGHVEIAVVDGAVQVLGQRAGGEEDLAGVLGQVLLAGGDQLLLRPGELSLSEK